ncbi:YbaB/EbfC family nucleoid-associated protein [Streptosporangium canum]|uniref:YbaB/EbfC family nucleoid-associated protein n=1 Tax=Streptosporangium canum TaxID=324952 RepID=UPI00339E1CD4
MGDARGDAGGIWEEEFDQAGRRAGRMLESIETMQVDLEKVTGVGEAASGQVKVTVAVDGKVLDVVFGPRISRLDSRTLAEHVLQAARDAQRDAERRTQELMREALDGFDPAEARTRLDRLLRLPW